MSADTLFRLAVAAGFWLLATGGLVLSRIFVDAGHDLAASGALLLCFDGLLLSAVWTGWMICEALRGGWRRISAGAGRG